MTDYPNSSEIKGINLPSGSWTQLPNQPAKSITFLNSSNAELTVKQLKTPALQTYSFEKYNPSGDYPCENQFRAGLAWHGSPSACEKYGFGEISTVTSSLGGEKTIAAKDPSKRLAAYTKINDLIDKNDLEITTDFFCGDASNNFPKINSLGITANVPWNWAWGSRYTTWNYTSSYPGGIGVSLFENPDWKISFTISDMPVYFFENGAPDAFRVVAYQQIPGSSGEVGLKYWTSSFYPSQNKNIVGDMINFTIEVPLYELADMELNSAVFITIERMTNNYTTRFGQAPVVNANGFTKVTPFQKIILRAQNPADPRFIRPLFAASVFPTNNSISLTTLSLDSLTRVDNENFRLDFTAPENTGCRATTVEWSFNADFSNPISNTLGCASSRLQRISGYNGAQIYFRVKFITANGVTLTSNILSYRSNTVINSFTFSDIRTVHLLNGTITPPSSQVFYSGINCPHNLTNSVVGFINAPWNWRFAGNTEFLRRIHTFNPNSMLNIFVFAGWSTKPYPESLPFSSDPNLGRDAYRFTFNLYEQIFNLYHGNTTPLNNFTAANLVARKTQLNTYPFFNLGAVNACPALGFFNTFTASGFPVVTSTQLLNLSKNNWNTIRIKFSSGIIQVYLNNALLAVLNDKFYRTRNTGDYIGVTSSHVFSDFDIISRLDTAIIDSMTGRTSCALPADIHVKNFKINSINISNIGANTLDNLSPLSIASDAGMELDGVTDTNQFFVKNNSRSAVNISYRITN